MAAACTASAAQAAVEVVVTLDAPPLATAHVASRVLTARAKAQRLDVRAPSSVSYVRALAQAQRAVAARVEHAIPSARVRWRYRIVANGFAVVVPNDRLAQLSRIPGVAQVWPSLTYHPLLDRSPEVIGADQLWGLPDFTTAGNGVKIGILDQGIDQRHPFFDPTGYVYPPGFPKGDAAYTTPKVIVARAFTASTTYKYARLPYDPVQSDHGDHVAGIAAGDYTVNAVAGRGPLSGVAPKAYLGNYKIAGVPTPSSGLDANSPEIAAGVEAAVRDGMDVINLSFGEPEIEPSRDIVVAAMDAAAEAGVVPTIAAGNEFDSFGRGSVSSPANAPEAIAAAAATKDGMIAFFSSGGPTPISLQLKPDVTAPGVAILSSVPKREGTWSTLSGTSMAAPHVAGAAALLKQRHPDWTVAQVKSALVLTGEPVYVNSAHTIEASTTREGGGMINLPRANAPLVFAAPTNLAFGLLRAGVTTVRSVDLTDAGGGAGDWAVNVAQQGTPSSLTVTAPATVTVPGRLDLTAAAAAGAPDQDATGFVVLTRGTDSRRIPYWLHVETPRLGPATGSLARTGDYAGNTRGKPSRVSSYRYPDAPQGSGVVQNLAGPEQVFRVRVTGRIANFGVAVTGEDPGVRVFPRIVANGDENRLTGVPALPLDINPFLPTVDRPQLVAAAIAPAPGVYDVVFDTTSAARAGRFTFRFWENDTSPPAARLTTPTIGPNDRLIVALSDAGSGIDPTTAFARIDANRANTRFADGQLIVPLNGRLAAGRHTLELQISDYQEEKNMESFGPILGNTRTLKATFTLRSG